MRILSVYQGYALFGAAPEISKIGAIARGLQARSHEVTILTADYASRAPLRREIVDGVEVLFLGTVLRARALTVNPALLPFTRRCLQSFDIVHLYGLYDLLGPAIALSCRRRCIPYVVEPMGMLRPKNRGLMVKRAWHALVGHRLLAGAAAVIANSEQERQELLDCGIPASRIVLRRNGVDIPETLPPPGAFRRRLGIPGDRQVVLYVGRLTGIKRLDLLVEAFAGYVHAGQGSNAALVLAGPEMQEGHRAELEALAVRLGLDGRVHFPGPLYGETKWAAYRDADVFVLPSEYESFGNVAAEALVAGTPVVVTDRCGIAAMITDALGRVAPHSAAGLRAALTAVLDPRRQGELLRDDRAARAAAMLSWEVPIAELDELYRSGLRIPDPHTVGRSLGL